MMAIQNQFVALGTDFIDGFRNKPDIRPLHNRVLVGDCLAELKKIPIGFGRSRLCGSAL